MNTFTEHGRKREIERMGELILMLEQSKSIIMDLHDVLVCLDPMRWEDIQTWYNQVRPIVDIICAIDKLIATSKDRVEYALND